VACTALSSGVAEETAEQGAEEVGPALGSACDVDGHLPEAEDDEAPGHVDEHVPVGEVGIAPAVDHEDRAASARAGDIDHDPAGSGEGEEGPHRAPGPIEGVNGDADRAKISTHVDVLSEPLRWKKPRKYVFVCSGSDLFHESADFDFVAAVFGVMAVARHSTFQVLTKRLGNAKKNALRFFEHVQKHADVAMVTPAGYCMTKAMQAIGKLEAPLSWWTSTPWPLPNVWVGASVEDRERKSRIDDLRKIPAAIRFLSIEPLLEELGPLDLYGIDWVIVGGEAGIRARPFDAAWARAIVNDCYMQNVRCFVKQLGAKPFEDGYVIPISDAKGGNMNDFPSGIRVREFPR
jgi:protein gp37